MSVRALQAGFICLLCLGGCTISPHEAGLAVDVERTLPRVVLLNDTPFFPQTDYQCGPAALATVLQAQGIDIAPADLSPGVYLPGRKGSLQVEMVAAARRYRSLPYVLDASFTACESLRPVTRSWCCRTWGWVSCRAGIMRWSSVTT